MRHPLQVHWSDDAERDLRKLDRRTCERIINAVDRYAETGHGDISRDTTMSVLRCSVDTVARWNVV